MRLVIAEKPSVANAISKVLGATTKGNGFFKNDEYIVSWCVGHLVGLAEAHKYDEKYKKWNIAHLPILPENWLFEVSEKTKPQFSILKKLINDKEVKEIICATDAGREGELIFRLVYKEAKCTKPFKRLWISSMEEKSISDGFKNLKPSSDYDNLYNSALARATSDWIVGINATRLFSSLYYAKLLVGRVQTPTLAMIVNRQKSILSFKKEKYYNVEIRTNEIVAKSQKIVQEEKAKELSNICINNIATCKSVEREQKSLKPPKLYDLTTLQREANRVLGYTAQQTLDYTQSLYEKKLVTYPRTDSQFITDDMEIAIPQLVQVISDKLGFNEEIDLENLNTKSITNSKKVTDHHGIIPTLQAENFSLDTLTVGERNVFMLISNTLLCSVSKNNTFENVVVTLVCGETGFIAKGKVIKDKGFTLIREKLIAYFKEILGANGGKTITKEVEEAELLDIKEGQVFKGITSNVIENFTSPPKYYTEDTLLSSMETAGNEEFEKGSDIAKKGIGTPATRASVIEKLISSNFIERNKKQLVATEMGINLISVLPNEIKTPKLTAQWETALQLMEKGEVSKDSFMKQINEFIQKITDEHRNKKIDNNPFQSLTKNQTNKTSIGICPRCGKSVYENKLTFACEDKACNFTMWKNDKFFKEKKKELTKSMAEKLLKNGKVKVKDLYSEKRNKSYDAVVFLVDTGKYVNYKIVF